MRFTCRPIRLPPVLIHFPAGSCCLRFCLISDQACRQPGNGLVGIRFAVISVPCSVKVIFYEHCPHLLAHPFFDTSLAGDYLCSRLPGGNKPGSSPYWLTWFASGRLIYKKDQPNAG